ADDSSGEWTAGDTYEQPRGGGPRVRFGLADALGLYLRIDAIGRDAPGHFAEGDEIFPAESTLQCISRLLGVIYAASLESLQVIVRREIDKLDIGGLIKDAIGNG